MSNRPDKQSLSAEELTRILYTHFLGRQPEGAAIRHLPQLIEAQNDLGPIIKGFIESDEFQQRSPREALAMRAHAILKRSPRIIDVGAQTLGPGSHAYDALLNFCPVEITGFDPLEDRLRERQEAESGHRLTLMPFALGDGNAHPLHVNNMDTTSSFYALNEMGNRPFLPLAELQTVRIDTVETRRLDDVIAHEQVDFLKLDIQGAELLVLQHSETVLKKTAVIHCEVEFSPIYREQPLFADVSSFLASQGFYFLDFATLGHYAHNNRTGLESCDRLMWADAVFLRDSEDLEIKAAQALCAAVIYNKLALAAYLLKQ